MADVLIYPGPLQSDVPLAVRHRPDLQRESIGPPALVAYRGLWDRFAGPGTLGALRRAYLRGIPSLARLEDREMALADIMTLVADPAVNRRRQPVYLMTRQPIGAAFAPQTSSLSSWSIAHLAAEQAPWLRVFAVDASDNTATLWPMCRWNGRSWIRSGVYIPAKTVATAIDAATSAIAEAPCVLFESLNVVDVLADQLALGGHADRDASARIRAAAGPHAALGRVSDLVELDQLDARIREAC